MQHRVESGGTLGGLNSQVHTLPADLREDATLVRLAEPAAASGFQFTTG